MGNNTTALAHSNGTAMINYEGVDFDTISDEQLAAIIQAEQSTEMHLMKRDLRPTVLRVGAAAAQEFVDKKTKETLTDERGQKVAVLTGVVLAEGLAAALWVEKFGKGDDKLPFCTSFDGVTGKVNIAATQRTVEVASRIFRSEQYAQFAHPIIEYWEGNRPYPEQFACASCACNQFGTARYYGADEDSQAKACQESRLLLVNLDGWFAPVILRVSKGSLKAWAEYKSKLLATSGKMPYQFRTQFGVQPAKSGNLDYTQLTFTRLATLDLADMREVMRLRTTYKNMVDKRTLAEDLEYYASDADAQTVDAGPADAEEAPPF